MGRGVQEGVVGAAGDWVAVSLWIEVCHRGAAFVLARFLALVAVVLEPDFDLEKI